MTRIRELYKKIEWLAKDRCPVGVVAGLVTSVAALARVLGEANGSIREQMGLHEKDAAINYGELDERVQRKLADLYGFDPTWPEWIRGTDRQFEEKYRAHRIKLQERRSRCPSPVLAPICEGPPVETRYSGLRAEVRLDARMSGEASTEITTNIQAFDFERNGRTYRVKKLQLEVHFSPAIFVDENWIDWLNRGSVEISGLPKIAIRPIVLPPIDRRNQRDADELLSQSPRRGAQPELLRVPETDSEKRSWSLSPLWELNAHGAEFGSLRITKMLCLEQLQIENVVRCSLGARVRDIDPISSAPNISSLTDKRRRNVPLVNMHVIRAIEDKEMDREANGYFVISWHTMRFMEAGR